MSAHQGDRTRQATEKVVTQALIAHGASWKTFKIPRIRQEIASRMRTFLQGGEDLSLTMPAMTTLQGPLSRAETQESFLTDQLPCTSTFYKIQFGTI